MTWTTAFGDHIIEKHICSLLGFVLLLCGDTYVFVGSSLPGATFLVEPQSWLLSNRNCVPSTISTSVAPTPDRFLCFAEENVVNMIKWWRWWSWWWGWWSIWRGWWSWFWKRCSLWWGWWRWWSRQWFQFPLQTFAIAIFVVLLWTPRVILGIDRCVCIDSMYVYHRFTDCTSYRLKLRMNIIWSVHYFSLQTKKQENDRKK